MISALRGWRRKKFKNSEEFATEFETWLVKRNKRALMVKVNGTSYGRAQLIHKGKKP